MADISVTSTPDVITELLGREDFLGVVVSAEGRGEASDAVTPDLSADMDRRRAANVLHQAADVIENGG